MIVLSTTATTVDGILEQARSQRGLIEGVELRVDLLHPDEWDHLSRLPAAVRLAAGDEVLLIATVRRERDGGRAVCSDARRLELLREAVAAGVDYIDLEADLDDDEDHAATVARAREGGVAIIRSVHDFDGVPDDLVGLMRELPRASGEIAKCAATPRSTTDLVRLVRAADALGEQPRILLGMGDYGFATRVLAHRLGNLLTFASVPGESAAPGHASPELLATLYRVGDHTDRWRYFAVIGNPIAHSKSPTYHNQRFADEGVEACYLPILVDETDAFFELADALPLLGCSVTIPHKRAVLSYLADRGDDVRAADACNTLVRVPEGWRGVNTDVIGFLAPLDEVLESALDGVSVLVVGAGGAARGVVYALLSRGADVLIWNRTRTHAEDLVRDLRGFVGTGSVGVLADEPVPEEGSPSAKPFDVVVNTTSVGMHGEGDPATWYAFSGHEIAYDIVYTPPETPFLERAAAAGCRVITGDRMFAAQAAAQYELFRVLAIAGSADA